MYNYKIWHLGAKKLILILQLYILYQRKTVYNTMREIIINHQFKIYSFFGLELDFSCIVTFVATPLKGRFFVFSK